MVIMDNKIESSNGIGCLMVVWIVFIILRLCGIITWSWWWVMSPFIISIALTILLIGLVGVIVTMESSKKNE